MIQFSDALVGRESTLARLVMDKPQRLSDAEEFARAALALKYDEDKPAPITESQILMPRRTDDNRRELDERIRALRP